MKSSYVAVLLISLCHGRSLLSERAVPRAVLKFK
jgi:hypothetical protein